MHWRNVRGSQRTIFGRQSAEEVDVLISRVVFRELPGVKTRLNLVLDRITKRLELGLFARRLVNIVLETASGNH